MSADRSPLTLFHTTCKPLRRIRSICEQRIYRMRTESLFITIYWLVAIAAGASTITSFGRQQASEARSIIQQIAVAKERGERRIQISVPSSSMPQYASFDTMDEALSNYAVVIARPAAKHSNNRVYTISTWYKF